MMNPALSQNKDPKIIAITGNIGSGKSAVCTYLRQKGYYCLDADEVVRLLKAPGEIAYNDIVSAFGKEVLDSDLQLNNQKLGEIIFNNKQKRAVLENIIHPKIWPLSRELADKELKTTKNKSIWFYEAALIIENNLENRFTELWFVSCPADIRRSRVVNHRGITPHKFDAINKTQLPETEKSKKATHTIQNNTDINHLHQQIDQLLSQYEKEPKHGS